MGNWYVNTVVKGVDQKRVGEFLNQSKRRAVVLPTKGGYTVVCDEASESFDEKDSRALNEELSKALSCKTACFTNADDDVLSYRLYENGVLVDEYYSAVDIYEPMSPSRFVEDDNQTHARRLAQFFGSADVKRLDKILSGDYVFAVERHVELQHALGLEDSAGAGYKYATGGEIAQISELLITGE